MTRYDEVVKKYARASAMAWLPVRRVITATYTAVRAVRRYSAPPPQTKKDLPHLVLLVSDSLRMRDWHNGTAPRIHKMCAERDDCFNSPHHYANAWGSDQGMFTLWCVACGCTTGRAPAGVLYPPRSPRGSLTLRNVSHSSGTR